MIKREKELMGPSQPVSSEACQAGSHLRKPADITGFPQFPAGTTSLLSKYLTKDIYDQYRGQQDKYGVSFEQMILSGCMNVDSGIGVYAGSHDAYTKFNGLFDKVIEDYHKHKTTDKHISNMNFKELNCPVLPQHE